MWGKRDQGELSVGVKMWGNNVEPLYGTYSTRQFLLEVFTFKHFLQNISKKLRDTKYAK